MASLSRARWLSCETSTAMEAEPDGELAGKQDQMRVSFGQLVSSKRGSVPMESIFSKTHQLRDEIGIDKKVL